MENLYPPNVLVYGGFAFLFFFQFEKSRLFKKRIRNECIETTSRAALECIKDKIMCAITLS